MGSNPGFLRRTAGRLWVVGVLAVAGGIALLLLLSAGARAAAFVRVDQVGYPSGAAKRAYLMTSVQEKGATFRVMGDGGKVALSGAVGARLSGWNKRFRYVYPLDFSRLRAPGTYSIAVSGPARPASPSFRIGPAATLFTPALTHALTFYEAERDGPDFIRSALRSAPGHLNDRSALTYQPPTTNGDGEFKGSLSSLGRRMDASGGWWDAGDYLKFVQTTSYTVDLLLTGVTEFPQSMGAGSRTVNFIAEARFGLDWLMRMWDDRTRTMYFQVGIGSGNANTFGDHDIWRLPQADDQYGGSDPSYRYIRHRPVFRAGAPGSPVSPNLAGRDAAAFALCFRVFRSSDPQFANRCLLAAEHVFALANTHPRQLTTVIPYDFYPETEWRDDLELGATELADAVSAAPLPAGLPQTSPTYYLTQAARWAGAYEHAADAGDPLNLYDVSGLASYELYRALQRTGHLSGLGVSGPQLLGGIRSQLGAAVSQAGRVSFGTGYAWSSSDTVSHLAGLSVMASEYAALTGNTQYRTWATRWLDDILGANPWGSSFIIGDGHTFPDCPQHQVANIVGSLAGGAPVLAGAAVEGPTSSGSSGSLSGMRRCPANRGDRFGTFNGRGAVFKDNVQSYSTDEPAIDLTASSPLAFAWQIGR